MCHAKNSSETDLILFDNFSVRRFFIHKHFCVNWLLYKLNSPVDEGKSLQKSHLFAISSDVRASDESFLVDTCLGL